MRDAIGDVKITSGGDIAFAVSFFNSVDFGDGPHMASDQNDIALARFDIDGDAAFSTSFPASGNELLIDFAIDADGQALLAGDFSVEVSFGDGAIASDGGPDAFVSKIRLE